MPAFCSLMERRDSCAWTTKTAKSIYICDWSFYSLTDDGLSNGKQMLTAIEQMKVRDQNSE